MSVNNICRISGRPLEHIINFGDQPLGNGFFDIKSPKSEYFFNMSVGFCQESKMFQLFDQPDPKLMFHDQYAFFSSTSKLMQAHFKDFYQFIVDSPYLRKDPFIVELGSNDGILLKNFSDANYNHLGIEPSENVAKVSNLHGVKTINEFFSLNTANQIIAKNGKADVFMAANVMCHIPNIKDVVNGIKAILKDTGVLIFEDPYLGDVIEKNSYDQIYDEHVFIFSAHSVKYLFNLFDLELIDAIHQETHGGSMRYIICHKGTYPVSKNLNRLLDKEKLLGLNNIKHISLFKNNVEKSKRDLLNLLHTISNNGKTIAGYAATSKSTTILNYCGIGPELIQFISDTTPLKIGKVSPGMHIPILSYEHFCSNRPDYAFLFAWNHSKEILANEVKFSKSGGKWISHVPNIRVID